MCGFSINMKEVDEAYIKNGVYDSSVEIIITEIYKVFVSVYFVSVG
jgi:hypothetical protein